MQTLPVKAEQTPDEIVRVRSRSLSVLNYGTGSVAFSRAVIASLVSDATEYFGVKWSAKQIAECAELWSSEYHWMTAAEIKLFLTRLKTGMYSKTDFRHLSPFQLMGWLGDYADDLLKARARYMEEWSAKVRREKLIAIDNNPDLVAFDAVKAFQAMGVKLSPDGKTPEQVERERIYQEEKRKQRERDRKRREETESNQ